MSQPAVKLRHRSVVYESRDWLLALLSLVPLTVLLVAPPASAQTRIAVTVDDVPWVGVRPADGADGGTDRLLTVFAQRGVPATGFVVCDNMLDGAPIVRTWIAAGMGIGSHTAAHRDLNRGIEPWLADVRRCDEDLAAVAGRHGGWFRFPYLHQGPDVATRDAAAEALHALGYHTAHVSIDNSEWVLANAYGRALRAGDEARMREIGRAYVAHALDAVRHFDAAARRKFGRSIDHVLLVHANALNADWLGAVLDACAEAGYEFVALDEALADPVYGLADDYAGPRGLSWVYRARPLSPVDPWDEAAEAALQARFGD